jgi:hypothetical protein
MLQLGVLIILLSAGEYVVGVYMILRQYFTSSFYRDIDIEFKTCSIALKYLLLPLLFVISIADLFKTLD